MGQHVAVKVGIVGLVSFAALAQAGKSFRDPQFGVQFQYPAQWTADAALRLEPQPLILSGQKPLARLGVAATGGGPNPFPRSTFEGAEFVAVVVEGASAKTCRQGIPGLAAGERPATEEINGVQYARVASEQEDERHAVDRTVYAAFRERRCFLFEEDIHDARTVAADGVHMFRPEERAELKHQLDAIMGSVQYLGGLAK